MARKRNDTGSSLRSPVTVLRRWRLLTSLSSTPVTSSTTVLVRNWMLAWAMARSSMMRLARKRSVRLMTVTLVAKRVRKSALHGEIAAANDGDLLARGEEAVARGAGADAVADERLLTGQAEPARGRSRRNDERARADGLLVGANVELVRVFPEVDGDEVRHLEFGTEADRLLLHVLDQLRALDARRPARKVLDQRGDGELAAGLVAFDDERLEVSASGVDGGCEAGASGTQNDGVSGGLGS